MTIRSYRTSPGINLGPLGFLIVANLIVFVVVFFRPQLVDVLGLSRRDVLNEPWTMVTNLFVHSPFGLGHILGNMITLYFYGSYLIGLVGEKKFLFVYLVGGLLGNVAYLALARPFVTAIGASGAVFAVGGALMALRPKLPVYVFPIPVAMPLWIVVIGGFFIMTFPGIAWQAHLGGLVLGLAAGYYWRRNPRYY